MKKTLAIILSLLAFSVIPTSAAPVLDVAENEFVAKLSAEEIPGINIATGTALPFAFNGEMLEGLELNDYGVLTTNDYPGKTDENNSVLGLSKSAGGNPWGFINYDYEFEGGRTYHISWDVYYDASEADFALAWGAYLNIDGADTFKQVIPAKNKEWHTFSADIEMASGTTVSYQHRIGGETLADDLCVYIDNFAIYPYYKITYMANDGTENVVADVEYLLDSNGNVSNNYTPDASIIPEGRAGYSFAGWSMNQNANAPDSEIALCNSDVTLYAVWAKEIVKSTKPGLNMINSESTSYSFEGSMAVTSSFKSENGNALTATANPFKDDVNSSDTVMLESSNGLAWPHITFALPAAIDENRPVYVSFKYYKSYDPDCTEFTDNSNLWVVKNFGPIIKSIGAFNANSGWKQYSEMLYFSVKSDGTYDTDDINSICLGYQVAANETNTLAYFDDISYVPSYKATYLANDGTDTVVGEHYFLLDDAGNIRTTYNSQLWREPEQERTGYVFKGWSLSPDSAVADAPATVTLENEDLVYYGVWEKIEPDSLDEYSLRVGLNAGMRVYASVTTAQKNEATEYGFIAARADVLETIGCDAAELNLDLEYNGTGEGKLFVKGAAYIKDTDLDKYITEEDGKIIFAAVCTGLDIENKTQVTTQFVVRPYININGVYAYGKPVVKSLYEVASAIDTTDLPEEIQTYIATIIATAEAE